MGHALAVAKLRGHLDLTGHAGDVFQPVTRDQAGVIAGAAGDNLHRLRAREALGSGRTEQRGIDRCGAGRGKGCGERMRLLVNFLEHVVAVVAEVGVFDIGGHALHLALYRVTPGVVERETGGGADHDIALVQVDKPVGDLTQRQGVGGQEVLADAHAHD